ncbi:hypothetical protein, partial [Candidatus Pseudothioglobus singularis]
RSSKPSPLNIYGETKL